MTIRHPWLFLLWLFIMPASSSLGQFIWIEGEEAVSHTMTRHNWYDRVNKDTLSGGEWLSHFGQGTAPEALYRFEVTEAGQYHLWIRANSPLWTSPTAGRPVKPMD